MASPYAEVEFSNGINTRAVESEWDDYGRKDEDVLHTGLDPIGCMKTRIATRMKNWPPREANNLKHFWELHDMFHDRYILADVGSDLKDAHEIAGPAAYSSKPPPPFIGRQFDEMHNERLTEIKAASRAEDTEHVRQYYGHRYTMRKLTGDSLTPFEQVVYDYVSRTDPTSFKSREVGMLTKLYMMYLKDCEVDRCRELCTSINTDSESYNRSWEDQPVEAIGGYIPLQSEQDMCVIFRTLNDQHMISMTLRKSAANYFLMQSLTKNAIAKIRIGPWLEVADTVSKFTHLHKHDGMITLND